MNSESVFGKKEKRKKAIDGRLVGKHIQALTNLQTTSVENDKLRHKVSELEEYKLRADYYATLEQQIQILQKELSKCDTLHTLGKYTEEKIDEIRKEHARNVQEYKENMEKRYKNQIESCIAQQKEDAKEWRAEKEQTEQLVEELKTSNKSFQAKLEAATAMQNNTHHLVEELEETLSSFEEIKSRNEDLQESEATLQEQCSALEDENAVLQDNIDNVKYEKRKLRKEMNKMVMKITKYVRKIKELEQFQNTVSRLEFENSWGKHLHNKTLSDLKSLHAKHRDVVSELQAVTEERNLLKNQLSTVQNETEQLKEELVNSKHSFVEFLELKRQVEMLREENKALSKKSSKHKLKMLKPDATIITPERVENADRQLVPVEKFKAIKSS